MSVFKDYASYYNLLYKDKAYIDESSYVLKLLERHINRPLKSCTILDLGCGTGRHDFEISKSMKHVTGIDQSEEMLNLASEYQTVNIEFLNGDVRNYRDSRHFDAVISLFHVASYQTSNEDFDRFLETASYHLEPGGMFVFDFWYGPAVLNDPPKHKTKTVQNEQFKIHRITVPTMFPNENLVNVNFELNVTHLHTGEMLKIVENHRMRYWFLPEILFYLKKNGFVLADSYQWMTSEAPGIDSWYVVISAQKT